MIARIEEIRIQNFRSLENVRLKLSDLTFLVGRNGAGKSSLLDAVEFMREAVTDSLPNALNRRDGYASLRRAGARPDEPIGLAVVMSASIVGRPLKLLYGFRFGQDTHDGTGMFIDEALRVSPTTGMGFSRIGSVFLSDNNKPGPPAVPKNRLVLPLVVADELWEIVWDTLARMRVYEIDPRAIASPAAIQSSTNLEKTGANAGDVLEEVELRPVAHLSLVESLRAVTPGISHVSSNIALGRRIIDFAQRFGGETRRFTAGQVSQGTLRSLGMLLALHQLPEPSLVLIDEVEDSIHPRALQAILEAAEGFAESYRVVMTTHSPEVLSQRQVTPDRIHIVQWNDGVSSLYPLSDGTKESVDPVTTAGDLLRLNALWPSETPERVETDLLELGQ